MEAALVLDTGEVLSGHSLGVAGIAYGELIFNTGMTGYQEILTDPSYYSQIITFTYPHIGNVGINLEDFESAKIWAAGIIVKNLACYFSNWQATGSLTDFLRQQQIVGIANIDTRYITQKIRDGEVKKAVIMAGKIEPTTALTIMQTANSFAGPIKPKIGVKTITPLITNQHYNVVVIDFGVKRSILTTLAKLNCNITLVPATTSLASICQCKPDGIVLTNGPGDPLTYSQEICLIQQLLSYKIPMFGICLGFQLLALALGAKTAKMRFGQHGINHPIQDITSKQIFITSQNHGFTVLAESLAADLLPTHYSLFDNSVQGFSHKNLPLFALQGHPEASPGPSDGKSLWQPFLENMDNYKKNKRKNCNKNQEVQCPN